MGTARETREPKVPLEDALAALPFTPASYNLDLEMALIGALLVDNRVAKRLPPGFDESAFFDPLLAELFGKSIELIESAKSANSNSVGKLFKTSVPIDKTTTVPQFIRRLEANTPTTISAPAYANALIDLARERLISASDESWRAGLLLTAAGNPKPLLANAITALRYAPEWRWVFGYDELAMATTVLRRPPWEFGQSTYQSRAWTPRDDALATNWLQHVGIPCGIEIVQQAVEAVAQDAKFHSIRDYLSGLHWDGSDRIDAFASRYLGATSTDYTVAACRCWLIAAIARVMRPGCKADHVLIIEGPQGVGKSSAAKALGGDWHTDELADLGSKDAAMQTRGGWIIEISELDAMSRAEASKIKAFVSRTIDRFRPPYGRRVIESPRQCVFIGTTNADTYLKDETGGRRFWPIKAGRIDVDGIIRDRDQLWAEALARFERGESWWLTGADVRHASEEQAARYVEDAWQGLIERYLERRTQTGIEEILRDALGLDQAKWPQTEQNRVARCLKQLGWRRHQKRGPGGQRHWCYTRDIPNPSFDLDGDGSAVTTQRLVPA